MTKTFALIAVIAAAAPDLRPHAHRPPGSSSSADRDSRQTPVEGQQKGYWRTAAIIGSALLTTAAIAGGAIYLEKKNGSLSRRWPF